MLRLLARDGVAGIRAGLHANFHEDLEADAGHAVGECVHANDLGEIFAVHGAGFVGIGHGDEQAHADFVAGFAGLEIDAGARDADGAAHIVEVLFFRVGRANAHQLGDLAAAAAAAFGLRGHAAWNAPPWGVLLIKSCVAMAECLSL